MAELHTLYSQIGSLIADTMKVEVPSTDTDLFESGALDSLGFVDLLARLEQEFGIRISIDDVEIDNFRCIKKIAGFIATQKATAHAR